MKRLHFFIILFCSFLCSKSFAEVVLNVESFKVAKNLPAVFLLDLVKDDVIIVSLRQKDGSLDESKAMVEIIDLNSVEETVLDKFGTSNGQVRIPYNGKYKIKVSYSGKGITLRGWQYGMFSLKIESIKTKKQLAGEFRNLMQATNIALDDDKENGLKLLIDVKAGDKISITSSDPKASIIKVTLLQMAKTGFISNFSNLTVERDVTLTITFYLTDNNDGKSMFNVSELIKRGDIQIEDLVVSLEKKAKLFVADNPTTGSNENNNQNSAPAVDNYQNALLEQFKNSQLSAAEQSQNYAELLASGQMSQAEINQKMIEAFNELSKEKEYVTVGGNEVGDFEIELGPAENLFRQNKSQLASNRVCQELTLRSTFSQWFYWLGVGDGAKDAFDDTSDKYYKSSGQSKTIIKAKAEYIYYSQDPTKNKTNPPFPTERMYPSEFIEDVKYAIVDEYNRKRFLEGLPYQQRNVSSREFVTADEGYAFMPLNPDEILSVCFLNNNKRTPVKVHFRYFQITVDKELK